MSENYYIGAYWGARLESPAACAERLLALLTELTSARKLTDYLEASGALVPIPPDEPF